MDTRPYFFGSRADGELNPIGEDVAAAFFGSIDFIAFNSRF